jgi:hypothetical protein
MPSIRGIGYDMIEVSQLPGEDRPVGRITTCDR